MTHYLNVNEALIEGGFVEVKSYDNEFSYYSFQLYLAKSLPDQPIADDAYLGLIGAIAIFAAITIIIIFMVLKKR